MRRVRETYFILSRTQFYSHVTIVFFYPEILDVIVLLLCINDKLVSKHNRGTFIINSELINIEHYHVVCESEKIIITNTLLYIL